jgi:hypothetical protein
MLSTLVGLTALLLYPIRISAVDKDVNPISLRRYRVLTHGSMLLRYCQMTVTGSTATIRTPNTPSSLIAPPMPIVLDFQLPVAVALRLLFSTLAHTQCYRLTCTDRWTTRLLLCQARRILTWYRKLVREWSQKLSRQGR